MQSQKHLFDLPDDVTYLNGAYMSPQLKSVTEIGVQAVQRKARPNEIAPDDFFNDKEILKQRFSALLNAPDYRNMAIIPSVSYGIANAANNIRISKGDEIILVDEQFPSNVYAWQEIAKSNNAIIKIVYPPKSFVNRGKAWNDAILKSITKNTVVIALPQVHWADGTLFDLKAIREKTNAVNAMMIVDGTQSVGALPFDIQNIQPDALICGGYKWLLGPYSIGLAYYSDAFNNGTPIEHNWMNRLNSEDFSGLTNYEDRYKEKAARYSVGESSNFILTPMLKKSIEQLLQWKPTAIQVYCRKISEKATRELLELGYYIEEVAYRAHHLFGIYLPKHVDIEALKQQLKSEHIFVSYRGDAIRISCSVYNTEKDFEKLVSIFRQFHQK